jgi:hypothetical protein
VDICSISPQSEGNGAEVSKITSFAPRCDQQRIIRIYQAEAGLAGRSRLHHQIIADVKSQEKVLQKSEFTARTLPEGSGNNGRSKLQIQA